MQKKLFGLVVASTFAAALTFAQPPGGGPGGPRSGNPPTAADMIQHRIDFLTKALSLTPSQQDQAKTIYTNAATSSTTIHDGMKTAHQALADAVKTNNFQAIDQAATTIGNLTAQSTANEAKADAAFYQILTPDQQTQFTQLHSRGPGGFGGRMGPGPARFGRQRQ
jgi:Spy/CpxP family protein refolding chaperone